MRVLNRLKNAKMLHFVFQNTRKCTKEIKNTLPAQARGVGNLLMSKVLQS
jgi:hypothetical protein